MKQSLEIEFWALGLGQKDQKRILSYKSIQEYLTGICRVIEEIGATNKFHCLTILLQISDVWDLYPNDLFLRFIQFGGFCFFFI